MKRIYLLAFALLFTSSVTMASPKCTSVSCGQWATKENYKQQLLAQASEPLDQLKTPLVTLLQYMTSIIKE